MSASVFSGNAQTISREQAQTLASEFFAQGTRATRAVTPALAYQWDSRHLSPVATVAAEETAPAFYTFAPESGEGFVIISSDANNPRVLGYSLDSNLPDVQNLPDGMRDFLTEYSVAPAKAVQSRASYNETTMGKIIVNLNTAPWGQRTPFNKFCYVAGGAAGSAITGCVPTAYSILMYYHKWPVAAKPVEVTHSGTGEKRMLGHEYDWANMLHSYSGTYTTAQADAVATLMHDMGWAYEVLYSANVTSTAFGKGEGAAQFIDVFKYKSNTPTPGSATKATIRDNTSNELWKQYIKQSLDAGLPIPYSSTTSATGTGRHIYILDGYTENDYYHFNWGWNGTGNGWFQLSDMTPLEDGSNYSNSHRAYFMLSPDKGVPCTITVSTDCGTCGTVSASYGSTTGESITVDQGANVTLTATPYSGYIFEKWTCGTEDVSTSATCKVSANSSAEYVAHFVATTATYQISTSVFGDEGGTAMLQIEGDEPTTNGDVIPGREVTLIAEPEEGYQFVKWTSGTNDISDEATYTFVPNASAQYVAHFKVITHTVGVSTSDAVFGLVQIDGATPAESASKEVNYGTEVTLTAEPKSGYVFKHWTSGGDVVSIDNPLRVDVTDDVNYVAVFIPQSQNTGVSIVATTDGGGTATVNSNNSVNAERNEEITLAATPASGYYFVEWRVGDKVVSTKATFTTSAQTARTYKAVFAALPTGNATINAYGRGGGNASVQNMTGTTLGTTNVSVPYGTTFKLVATKTGNVDFKCWTKNTTVGNGGEIISNDMVTEVVATESMKYFANFAAATSVSATASANTGGTAEVTGDKTYAGEVTFKATANTGYNFTNWTNAGGDVVSTEPYYTTLLTSDLALTANFEVSGSTGPSTPDVPTPEVYNISVSVNGTNGTATASSNSVTQGQQVTLTATPNAGYKFVNWTLGGTVVSTEATYTFTPTASGEYVANFAPITYTVQASTANRDLGMIQIGEEAGTGTTTQTATVNHGSTVTMHAIVTNPTLYRFVNWTSGTNVVSTDNPLRFTASANVDYVANFEVIPVVTPQYTISVSAANGQGVVTATSGTNSGTSLTVDQGTQVTLTATPNEGYQFVNWTLGGVEVSTNAEYTVIANATEEYVANFALKTYTLTVKSSNNAMGRAFFSTGSGTGTGTGTGTGGLVTEKTVGHGESVTMEAIVTDPSVYRFVNWTVNGVEVSTSTTFTTTATAAAEYVANFEEIPVVTPQYTISVNSSDSDYGTVAVLEFGTSTSQAVDAGTTLTLVATPKANCKFVKWTCNGEDIAGGATITITADADKTYVAVFDVIPNYSVNVSANPTNGGTATIWLGTEGSVGVTVQEGTEITLHAGAHTGYTFKNWTCGGEVVSTEATFNVTVAAAANYVANFEQDVIVEPEVPSTSPEDGKAYIIRNVHPNGNKYMLVDGYSGGSPMLPVATDGAAADYSNVFICRAIDVEQKKYAFVNAKNGKFMAFHGKSDNNPFTSDGFYSTYDKTNGKCDFIITEYATKPGHYSISGLRNRLTDAVGGWATMTIAKSGAMDANSDVHNVLYNDSYSSLFTFTEVLDYPNKVTLAQIDPAKDELIYGIEGKIGTFSAPYATVLPTGVTAYYAKQTDVDGTNVLHLTPLNATTDGIPANQGVILVGGVDAESKVRMIPATTEWVEAISDNAFSNTATGSVVMQTGDYVLARGEQGIGFYQATGTLKHNKAFLRLGNTSNVSAFRLVFGETTDLNSSVTIVNPDAPIYDLSGRRVMQTVKGGVYIQNGKKFIVK